VPPRVRRDAVERDPERAAVLAPPGPHDAALDRERRLSVRLDLHPDGSALLDALADQGARAVDREVGDAAAHAALTDLSPHGELDRLARVGPAGELELGGDHVVERVGRARREQHVVAAGLGHHAHVARADPPPQEEHDPAVVLGVLDRARGLVAGHVAHLGVQQRQDRVLAPGDLDRLDAAGDDQQVHLEPAERLRGEVAEDLAVVGDEDLQRVLP
jgi:hypothetical protein